MVYKGVRGWISGRSSYPHKTSRSRLPRPLGEGFLLRVSMVSCRSFHCLRSFTLSFSLHDNKALAGTVYESLKFVHTKGRQILFSNNTTKPINKTAFIPMSAMTPSSLVVKVEFITHNETSVANYTWSLNCLYVAIPPQVLQLLSLGSVLVEPRTQELKICIPHFCRNIASTKEQKDLMTGVLSAVRNCMLTIPL